MPSDGPLWSLDGVAPQLAEDAWVAPTAVVVGDVVLGELFGIGWFWVIV